MKIVSFIRDSFQEFEGYQSLVLFSKGCNFICNGCYNYDLITRGEPITDAISAIENLLTPMHEAVVFLGGEPTIWGQKLIDAAKVAKRKNMKVKVFSNGSNPSIIASLNEQQLVDTWSLDFKCIRKSKLVLGKEIQICNYLKMVRNSAENIHQHNLPLEIRTTLWPDVIEQQEDIKDYVQLHFPYAKHIFQDDFNENFKLISA